MRLSAIVLVGAIALGGASAHAGGFGEQRSVQFKTPNERQVNLNMERARLDYNFLDAQRKAQSNGCCAGTSSLTSQGAEASVNNNYFYQEIHTTIDGDGNQVIVTGGDQSSTQTATDIDQTNQNSQSTGDGVLNNGGSGNTLN